MTLRANIILRICRCSSVLAKSITSGTSGRSGCLASDSCTSTIMRLSAIQDLWVDFTLDHDQPQRPCHLAALHRQHHVVAAGIALDDLEMGAEHAVEHARKLIGVGAGAGAADGQLLGEAGPRIW